MIQISLKKASSFRMNSYRFFDVGLANVFDTGAGWDLQQVVIIEACHCRIIFVSFIPKLHHH
jgi:hypothetical protein